MWKIKHIFDGEYGCEELAEGQRPKVSVTLINEKEEETCFSVEVIRTVSPTFVLRFIRRCQYAYSAC